MSIKYELNILCSYQLSYYANLKTMKAILQTKWMSLVLLILAFSLIYNPLVGFPYTFCIIILYVILITYLQDGNLRNLSFNRIGLREIKSIFICYILLEFSVDYVFDPIINWLCNEQPDYSAFASIEGHAGLYSEWLFKMWISAALGEELLFRAFTFSQLKRLIPDKNIIAVIISAIMFCIPHLYQGIAGLLSTFVFGIAFGLIYLKFKNIWINIIVHGLIDTIFLTLSYLGLFEFYNLFG